MRVRGWFVLVDLADVDGLRLPRRGSYIGTRRLIGTTPAGEPAHHAAAVAVAVDVAAYLAATVAVIEVAEDARGWRVADVGTLVHPHHRRQDARGDEPDERPWFALTLERRGIRPALGWVADEVAAGRCRTKTPPEVCTRGRDGTCPGCGWSVPVARKVEPQHR